SKYERSVAEGVHSIQRRSGSRQYGGGYDDCSSNSLGIFNFLTFLLYAFSLLLTLLVLASDDLAGTFFGNILNLLAANNNIAINNNNSNMNTNSNMNSNMNVNMNGRSLRAVWDTMFELFQPTSNRNKRYSHVHRDNNTSDYDSKESLGNFFKSFHENSTNGKEEHARRRDWVKQQLRVGAVRAMLQLSHPPEEDMQMCQTAPGLSTLVTKFLVQEASSR
ncbi:unnamed protein product, partial [Meganyctiphanes norvegica]